jgi:dTDP-4-amino-4,6-dideoxygalactose transaminase
MSDYKINFINASYRRFYAKHRSKILNAIDKCYKFGDFVLRDEVHKFEANLAKFTDSKYALGVNSGTDALKIAYKALGLKEGDEVITVSHVFIAPIQEIVHLGGKPVLIDIKEDGLMDEDLIEKAITKKTVGIVPIHLSGKVCNMDKIMKIAKKHKLWVVEDACQALGATYKGKSAGSIGDIGCFSHIAPKTLGVGGDAGSIVTNNRKLYERMNLLRNHWNITQGVLHGHQPKQPKVMDWGYNSRLDNVHASVLNIKIKLYPEMLKRRKAIGMMYNKGLKHLQDKIQLPIQYDGQIYQEYIIKIPDMYKFKAFMDQKGIELLIRDVVPNHKTYEWYFGKVDLPVTDKHATSSVRLPTYPELTNLEVRTIIKAINEFFKK